MNVVTRTTQTMDKQTTFSLQISSRKIELLTILKHTFLLTLSFQNCIPTSFSYLALTAYFSRFSFLFSSVSTRLKMEARMATADKRWIYFNASSHLPVIICYIETHGFVERRSGELGSKIVYEGIIKRTPELCLQSVRNYRIQLHANGTLIYC